MSFRNKFLENKVLKIYNYWLKNPEDVLGIKEDIEDLAKKDPRELQNLVDLFNRMEERDIDERSDKLHMAEILSDLGYEPVKKFLVQMMWRPTNESPETDPFYGWSDRRNKIWAACNLVKFEDLRGKEFLEEFVEEAGRGEKDMMVDRLYPIENDMAQELLLTLSDKDEYIGTKRVITPSEKD